jgi:hypothetical protein
LAILAIVLLGGSIAAFRVQHQPSSSQRKRCAIDSHILVGSLASMHDVRVEEEVCDDFAHSDVVSVFLRAKGSGGRETLALRYEPDRKSHAPEIIWLDARHLQISVNLVSDVLAKQAAVSGIAVSCRLGKVLLR